MAKSAFDFLARQPFALVGALGLISLADFAINLPVYLDSWIAVWRFVTEAIWKVVLGWTGITLSGLVQDYFSIGLVFSGAVLRSGAIRQIRNESKVWLEAVFFVLISMLAYILVWPLLVLVWFSEFLGNKIGDELTLARNPVFYESFVYAAIVIAASYVFFGDPI